ncbi:MAG: hypothetical protein FWF96_02685, partial [Kiritimatiellaeota bacterium]|nr:hypothetical protein [Kiritimatiellota bacterium]
ADIEKATAEKTEAAEKVQQAQEHRDAVAEKENATPQEQKQAENNVKNAENALQRADNRLADAQKRQDTATAAEARHAEQVQQQAANLDNARQKVEEREAAIEQARQNAAQQHSDMTPAQQDAKAAQLDAKQLVAKAREIAKAETPSPELNAELFASEPLDLSELYKMDVVDLYDTAVNLENRILETYRDVRATERAIRADMSIENARRLTDVASTTRPEINREILRAEVRTDADLDQHKEAVAQAVRETSGIHQSVSALLETVRQVAQSHDGFSVDLAMDWAQLMAEYDEAATAEFEEMDTADLADLMREAMGEHGEHGEREYPHSMFQGQGEHGPDDGRHGALPRRPALNAQAIANLRGDGRLPGRVMGSFHTTSDPRQAVAGQSWGKRVVGPGGVPSTWLGLTTWYVIGPFPNPARANIDRKFPPETVVDLDAVYEGKHGPIAWEFYQSPFPQMVTPRNTEPYGIWYGYTEIRFDRACDLWVAIGSDDKSKIWVNDFCVWESAPQHKPWRPHEGFRKIHFGAGVNRILYRCENGQHGMGWSFVINLDPAGQ